MSRKRADKMMTLTMTANGARLQRDSVQSNRSVAAETVSASGKTSHTHRATRQLLKTRRANGVLDLNGTADNRHKLSVREFSRINR